MAAWSYMTKAGRDDAVRKACEAGVSLAEFTRQYGVPALKAQAHASALGTWFAEPRPLLTEPIEELAAAEPEPDTSDIPEAGPAFFEKAQLILPPAIVAELSAKNDEIVALAGDVDRLQRIEKAQNAVLATMNLELEAAREEAEALRRAAAPAPIAEAPIVSRQWTASMPGERVGADVLDYLAAEDRARLDAMAGRTQQSAPLVAAKLIAAVLFDDAVANGEAPAPEAPIAPPPAADIVAGLTPVARAALHRQALKEETLPTTLVTLIVETVCRDELWDAVLG